MRLVVQRDLGPKIGNFSLVINTLDTIAHSRVSDAHQLVLFILHKAADEIAGVLAEAAERHPK